MTHFLASLPVPAHNLPGGRLASSIRDALTLSSFRAHMSASCPPVVRITSGRNRGEVKRTRTPGPVDVTAPHPLEPILSAHLAIARPAVADGRPCVCFRELAGLLMPGELPTAAAAVLMPLAGVMPSRPWRSTRDRGSSFTLAAEPWVTMREAEAIIKVAPGLEAKRVRVAMRREGWRPC